MPISFELDAATLDVAIAKFGDAAEQAVQQTMRDLQEMRREQASSLVLPDAGGRRPARRLDGPAAAAPAADPGLRAARGCADPRGSSPARDGPRPAPPHPTRPSRLG